MFSGFSVDDLDRAKAFYQDVLGLKVRKDPMGFLELHTSGNNPMVIYPKEKHEPATFTILNFPVRDITETVDGLMDRGIAFEQYDAFNTDEKGISRMDGAPAIAWFKDPAGNILSIIEA